MGVRGCTAKCPNFAFPEYASMELASLFDSEIYSSLSRQLAAMQTLRDDYLRLFQQLAKTHQCLIVAGSFPVQMPSGEYQNRADVFMPDGSIDFQDKLMMTRFETSNG